MIRYISIVFIALVCLGCQGSIKFVDAADGYKKVLGSDFYVFIVRDEGVLKDYHSLFLLPLALNTMEIDKETESPIARTWKPDEEARQLINDYFSKAKSLYYEKKREEHSFNLVNNAAQGVMAVEYRIKKFRPYMSRDISDMDKIVTQKAAPSLGRLSLEITIIDAVSGEFIAYLLDHRHVESSGSSSLVFDKATQSRIWHTTFVAWFNDLDESIDRLKAAK